MNANEWIYRFKSFLLISLLFFIPGLGACSPDADMPQPQVLALADEKKPADGEQQVPDGHREKDHGHGEQQVPPEGHQDKGPGHEEKQAPPKGDQEKEPHGHKEPHRETQKPEPGGVVLSPEEQANIGLKTVAAEIRPVEDVRLLNGVVKPHPDRVALVTSLVAGRAADIHVNLGDRVEKGQDLADVQSVELEKIELDLIQAENKLKLVQANLERIRALVEKGIAAKKNLLAAESQHQAVLNEIDSLTKQLTLLGLKPEQIQAIRKEKTVTTLHLDAPLSGTVVERNVILGQAIEPNQPLFKILDDSVVIVVGEAFEDTLPLLKMRQSVRVRVPAYPKQVFEGRITFISPTVDPQKRTVQVWAEISNHHGILKQDLFADLSVALGASHQTVAVPLEALINADGAEFVFVEQGGAFIRRDLILGARDDRYAEVKRGLRSGERVVTDGKRQLYTKYLMSQRGGPALGGHGH